MTARYGFHLALHPGANETTDRDAGPWSTPALIRRFRRIEGQARGLQKMVEDERDADDLLMQIASVREALASAAAVILEKYLVTSAEGIMLAENSANSEQLLEKAVEVFRRWAT